MANQQSGPPKDDMKRIKAIVAWMQTESEHLEHCPTCDPKEACSKETTYNGILKQWRDGKMG